MLSPVQFNHSLSAMASSASSLPSKSASMASVMEMNPMGASRAVAKWGSPTNLDAIEQRIQALEQRLQQISAPVHGTSNVQSQLQTIDAQSPSLHKAQTAVEGIALKSKHFSAGSEISANQRSENHTLAPSLNGSIQERFKALQPLIQNLSQTHGVDPRLINALVKQESGFQPQVVSKAGALGLMQLMPATAQSLGVKDPLNPTENLDGGIRYLKGLLERFHGNIPLALAAYNAGPNAVQKYDGIPPYKETQHYVRTVLANYLKQSAT